MTRAPHDRDAAYVEYVAARQAHLRRIAYAVCGVGTAPTTSSRRR